MEPKTPEEVYKTWLESAGSALRPSLLAEHPVDSARQNLSATFVNAFVNAGFGRDKLVTTEDGNKWMYKNKDHGKSQSQIISYLLFLSHIVVSLRYPKSNLLKAHFHYSSYIIYYALTTIVLSTYTNTKALESRANHTNIKHRDCQSRINWFQRP